MTFSRSIAVSLLLHAAILGYAFLQFESVDDLRAEPSFSGVVVDYSHVEFAETNQELEKHSDREQTPRSELVSMDLEAGLDGDPETAPDEPEESAPRRDPPSPDEPEPEPSTEETPNDEPDRSEESAEPSTDALAASEESEADREVPERAPEPAEASESENEDEDAASGEERVAKREGAEASPSDRGGGSGSGSGATGRGRDEGAGGRPGIDRSKLIRQYTRKLHRRLAEKKYYPHAARRAGIEGTVQVEVTIDSEGNVLSVELHESSGHGILDRAALKIMRSLEKFPAPPEALAWSEKRLRVPIPYQLETRG